MSSSGQQKGCGDYESHDEILEQGGPRALPRVPRVPARLICAPAAATFGLRLGIPLLRGSGARRRHCRLVRRHGTLPQAARLPVSHGHPAAAAPVLHQGIGDDGPEGVLLAAQGVPPLGAPAPHADAHEVARRARHAGQGLAPSLPLRARFPAQERQREAGGGVCAAHPHLPEHDGAGGPLCKYRPLAAAERARQGLPRARLGLPARAG